MKPIVEGMGLDWAGQFTKLKAAPSRFSHWDIPTTGSDGKRYRMTCIPLRRYPMWLASINPEPVARIGWISHPLACSRCRHPPRGVHLPR